MQLAASLAPTSPPKEMFSGRERVDKRDSLTTYGRVRAKNILPDTGYYAIYLKASITKDTQR